MNDQVLEDFKKMFLDLKIKTVNEMAQDSEAGLLLESERGDDADQSELERIRSINLKLLGRHLFLLKKIDYGLMKIKNGTYGICEECEGDIEPSRLKARLVTSHCIACKEESERDESQMLYERKSHTHGRSLNSSNVVRLYNDDNNKNNVVSISGAF